MNKIKVAFLFNKTNYFLSGSHFDNYYYYFFMKALPRNQEVEIAYIPTIDNFDCRTLSNKFDIILSFETRKKLSSHYTYVEECKIPFLLMCGDPHTYQEQKKLVEEYGVKYFFFISGPNYFYKFYPSSCVYRQIALGVEPGVFTRDNANWNSRISNRILNTGETLYYNKELSDRFYRLRLLCSGEEGVTYISDKKWMGDKYPELFKQYRATIAATRTHPTGKFIEAPASSCVCFMEVTPENEADTLGFTDGENAIFINTDNYKEKFQEFLDTSDDPKWKTVSRNGYDFVMNNYTNNHGVSRLVNYMKEIIDD